MFFSPAPEGALLFFPEFHPRTFLKTRDCNTRLGSGELKSHPSEGLLVGIEQRNGIEAIFADTPYERYNPNAFRRKFSLKNPDDGVRD